MYSYDPVQYNTVQHSTAQNGMVQYGAMRCNARQFNTQHNTTALLKKSGILKYAEPNSCILIWLR